MLRVRVRIRVPAIVRSSVIAGPGIVGEIILTVVFDSGFSLIK